MHFFSATAQVLSADPFEFPTMAGMHSSDMTYVLVNGMLITMWVGREHCRSVQ